MAIPLYQDLWNGKETLSETVALRCGEKQLTFGDFFQDILRAEAGLRSLGVGPGDLVTLITLNTPEAVIAFYAIDRIGAVANWVDTKLSPTEVEEYLIRAQSKVVLVLELAFAKVYQNRGQAPAEHFITVPLACYLPDALGEKLHLNTWQEAAGPGCKHHKIFSLRRNAGKSLLPSLIPAEPLARQRALCFPGGRFVLPWSSIHRQRRSTAEGEKT